MDLERWMNEKNDSETTRQGGGQITSRDIDGGQWKSFVNKNYVVQVVNHLLSNL